MPIISQFYGIVISMYYEEDKGKHHKPHIHIRYNNEKAIFDFYGKILEGKIGNKQRKMIEAWIEIHKEELETLWKLMKEGEEYFKIDPLK